MLKVLDLFSGIGGFSLGLERTGGFETVAFCEIDPFCQKVLKKHWPDVPIYNDVRNLEYDGAVDVITGGFPCQDVSTAGSQRGLGEGTRSGLWSECIRLIGIHKPRYAIFENVTNLLNGNGGQWFATVLNDLAKSGYDAEWQCVRACTAGLPHKRDRVWILAYPAKKRWDIPKDTAPISSKMRGIPDYQQSGYRWKREAGGHSMERVGWAIEPGICGSHDGLPDDAHRIGSLGNSVIPQIPEMIGNAILEAELTQS
jgi:DNA (cytosine-5)-methyltransferase 1